MDWYDDDFSENLGIESSAEYLYDFSLTSSRAFPVGYDTPSSIAGEIGGDPERGSAEGTASDTASDSCGVGEGTSGGASTMGDSA
jgi:hypothetical protein